MARLLIATMPITGHVQPAVPIARKLVMNGHDVRWYTGKRFQSRVEAVGARFVPMKAAYDFNDLKLNEAFPGRSRLKDFPQLKFDLQHIFGDAGTGQVSDLQEVLNEFPADAILCDTGFAGARLLHELGGPPWAVFSISALTVSSRDTAPFGLGILPDRSAIGRIRNHALNALVNKVLFRDVSNNYNKTRASLGLKPFRGGIFDTPVSPFLYLQATVPSFEYPRSDLPPQAHFIGPFLPEASDGFTPPPWWREVIESERPVVHVTQGTSATDPSQLIAPTLRALANEDMWVVATTTLKLDEAGMAALGPIPANARVEPFIPYYDLLPHVRAMVTNCGYGGVQAALARGIPLVAAGNTEDKPEIANRISWSGVGINLRTKTPTPEKIREAVRAVMSERRYRQRAKRMQEQMSHYDAPAIAARLIEQLAATGQPCTSPSTRGRPAAPIPRPQS
ncbi:MAG: glycosyltransferase [Chloroflexia bacterium]